MVGERVPHHAGQDHGISVGSPFSHSPGPMTAPAGIVVFVGQPIDRPGAGPGSFPPDLEAALRRTLARRITDLGTVIGYSSAAAGADILFGEELLALGGELNLVLPCHRDDFVGQYVDPAGAAWRERFEALCAGARSVVIGCEEKLLGDPLLLRFNNQLLQGMARLRGDALGIPPHLLLAWSPGETPRPGSPADAMDQWPEMARLSIIDLDDVRLEAGLPSAPRRRLDDRAADALDDLSLDVSPRAIRAILFADMASYTQMADEEVPLLYDFLAEAGQRVAAISEPPMLVETWGDAVHAVTERAHHLADWTMALTRAVAEIDVEAFGLRRRPQFRMALHVGPVFVGIQPLTGRGTVFGHHISRTARIEPIVAPGAVCASAPFVAALRAEMDERADAARQAGRPYGPRYAVRYLGHKTLPKKFGTEELYQLIDPEMPGPVMEPEHAAGLGRMAPPDRSTLTVAGRPDDADVLTRRLEAFMRIHHLPPQAEHAILIALDELVANTISHGFGGVAQPRLTVSIAYIPDRQVRLELVDNGIPFDPLTAPPPDLESDVDTRPIGGLGVHLVRELTDEMRYERIDGRNRTTLIKCLEPDSDPHALP